MYSLTTTSTTECSLSQTLRRNGWLRGSHQMSVWLAATLCILWPSLATEMKGETPSLVHITLPPSHEVLPRANSVLGARITLGESERVNGLCVFEWDREGRTSKLCPGWARGGGGGEKQQLQISRETDGRKVWAASKTSTERKQDELEKYEGKERKDASTHNTVDKRSRGICSCVSQEDIREESGLMD